MTKQTAICTYSVVVSLLTIGFLVLVVCVVCVEAQLAPDIMVELPATQAVELFNRNVAALESLDRRIEAIEAVIPALDETWLKDMTPDQRWAYVRGYAACYRLHKAEIESEPSVTP